MAGLTSSCSSACQCLDCYNAGRMQVHDWLKVDFYRAALYGAVQA